MQYKALEVWDIVDLEGNTQLIVKPIKLTPLLVLLYELVVTL
jgi:hypothetical protein